MAASGGLRLGCRLTMTGRLFALTLAGGADGARSIRRAPRHAGASNLYDIPMTRPDDAEIDASVFQEDMLDGCSGSSRNDFSRLGILPLAIDEFP
jgi:hypothetical protein